MLYGTPKSPHFIFFTAAFAVLAGTSCSPVVQVVKENMCIPPKVVRQSTSNPKLWPGSDVIMKCEVNGTLSNDTNVGWSVSPNRTLLINASFQHQILDDGNRIRATLSLINITADYEADYTIKISNTCGSASCTFSLAVEDECSYVMPTPLQKEVTINIPQNMPIVTLVANFSGDSDPTHFLIDWCKNAVCDLESFGSKYSAKHPDKHRNVPGCYFTEKLIIHNVSMNDAGIYHALYHENSESTTFYVNVRNNQEGQKRKTISVYVAPAFSIVVLLTLMLAVGVGVCFRTYHKKKLRNRHLLDEVGTESEGEQEEPESDQHELELEVDLVVHPPNPWPVAPHVLNGHKRVFFLYCKTCVTENLLVDMAHVLAIYGILSCLDITTGTIPANWSIWTEEMIDSCDHVILVCTRPLYRALRNHVNGTDNYLVEMFKGKFAACAVVNCVQAPKFIPVFIDSTPDKNVVPIQLRTHHFFHLRVRELMQAVEGKSMEYVDREINNNPIFMDIKHLIDLLQQ